LLANTDVGGLMTLKTKQWCIRHGDIGPVFAKLREISFQQEDQLSLTNRPALVHVVFPTLRTYAISFDTLNEGDTIELSGSCLACKN